VSRDASTGESEAAYTPFGEGEQSPGVLIILCTSFAGTAREADTTRSYCDIFIRGIRSAVGVPSLALGIVAGELQSPGTGPFFGPGRSGTLGPAGRKHGPVPFCFDFAVLLGIVAVGLTCGPAVAYYVAFEHDATPESDEESRESVDAPQADTANLVTVGKNSCFNVEPGYRLRYEGGQATRTVSVALGRSEGGEAA
jgi:hypothetical protein